MGSKSSKVTYSYGQPVTVYHQTLVPACPVANPVSYAVPAYAPVAATGLGC